MHGRLGTALGKWRHFSEVVSIRRNVPPGGFPYKTAGHWGWGVGRGHLLYLKLPCTVSMWRYPNIQIESASHKPPRHVIQPICKFCGTYCILALGGLLSGAVEKMINIESHTDVLVTGYMYGHKSCMQFSKPNEKQKLSFLRLLCTQEGCSYSASTWKGKGFIHSSKVHCFCFVLFFDSSAIADDCLAAGGLWRCDSWQAKHDRLRCSWVSVGSKAKKKACKRHALFWVLISIYSSRPWF